MTIASILRNKGAEVASVAVSTPVRDVLTVLHDRRIGAVLVMDGGDIAGIVSERDIVRCLHQQGAAVLSMTAGDIMTSPVMTVDSTSLVVGAMALMTERRIRHLPVVDGGTLIGVVSIGDLVKRRIDMAEAEAAALKDYIATAG
jgi:CBS domain-containing protein